MTVVEISECFPNNFRPVTGEFILQHVKALSAHCKVIMLVPLRFIPSRELFSYNPVKLGSNLRRWLSDLLKTKNFETGNLKVIYFKYLSLPRPFFEPIDNSIINFFFYKKIRRIISETGSGLIYCNWIRPWAELSSRISQDLKIPLIIDHHEDVPTLKKLFPDHYEIFLKSFEKADGIVVHSNVNKKELINEKLNLGTITVNYLGQNFPVSESRKNFNFRKVRLACVSHLFEPRKNIDILIHALALIKNRLDFELKVAGEGSLKPDYINLRNKLQLENEIQFIGEKSQEQVGEILENSDIFILPSYPEAFGIVMIEALAKGLPVISCKGNGGAEELKQTGYPIILVSPNSPEELGEAIVDLSQDKSRMESMSLKGKEIVKNYFSWKKNADDTYELIKETIKNFNRKP